MCRCECVTSSEQMRIWKRIILQQLAVCVHTCVHEFLFINPSLLVGPLPSPLSSPSEGRTHIPVQLPDSSPGRRSAGADKWQGPQHMRAHAHTPLPFSPQTCCLGILPSAPLLPHPPHLTPISLSDWNVAVFKEIDWALIFVLAWSVELFPAHSSLSWLYIYEVGRDVRSDERRIKWEINQSWRVINAEILFHFNRWFLAGSSNNCLCWWS